MQIPINTELYSLWSFKFDNVAMSILNFILIFPVTKIKENPGERQQMTAYKGQCHILDFIFHKSDCR